MRVLLVRHGEAGTASTDDDRQLSEAGRRQAESQGRVLGRMGWSGQEIWYSRKVRAKETAELMAAAAGLKAELSEMSGLLPEDSPREIGEQLEAMASDVILVGHMPYMNYLASYLVTGKVSGSEWHFRTGAMLMLERAGRGLWEVEFFIPAGLVE